VRDHRADGGIGRRVPGAARGEFAGAAQVHAVEPREGYGRTSTPFQKATWSLICLAASLGAG
jgi:hypothetical protein